MNNNNLDAAKAQKDQEEQSVINESNVAATENTASGVSEEVDERRNKNMVMDFHTAITAEAINEEEIITYIIAAFQEGNIVLLREFVNDIVQVHNYAIFSLFTEQLFASRESPFFEAIEQKIMGSEVQDVLAWYVFDAIKRYMSYLSEEEQEEAVVQLIRNAFIVINGLSTQIKASFVDSIIRSCNPVAVITLLKRTDNLECAKEAVAHYLISRLSELDSLDSNDTESIAEVITRMFEPVLQDYTTDVINKFCRKIVRRSAKVLAQPLSLRETFEDYMDKSREVLSFVLASKEELALEHLIYSNAVVEIVLLNSRDPATLTPSQVIGDNTRKKAARVL